jgi:RND superfamily putative drug exporter
VLFAGTTVVLAIAGLQVSGIPMMTMMGWASALMVAIGWSPAVTLLPALLGIAGKRVNSLPVPVHQAEAGQQPAVEVGPVDGQGRRQAGALRRRGSLILAVAGHPDVLDAARLPRRRQRRAGTTTREAYDLMADKYGAGVNGPLAVVVETTGRRRQLRDRRLTRASPPTRASPRSTSRRSRKKDLAIISVTPTTAPQDAKTSALLERLATTSSRGRR